MRLPNHYGTVYKLKGKRHRPYVAKKYIGKVLCEETKSVKQVYSVVGYYTTRAEALNALANHDPEKHTITLREAYESWSVEYFPKLKETQHYTAAWKVLEPLWDSPINELRHDDLQLCMKESGKNAPTLRNVKIVLAQLFEYAYIHEYVPITKKEMVAYLDVGKDNPKKLTRRIFTEAERAAVLRQNDSIANMTRVLIYTGLRISELCEVSSADVDCERQCITIRKAKTAAGIREVPIADAAVPYVREYLKDRITDPKKYREALKKRFGHLPHDTRHTFATMMTENGCDQRIIDSILGHVAANNTALSVYTHITLEAKLAAVNLLVFCKLQTASSTVLEATNTA